MKDDSIELLRDLIAIDSVNPSLVPGAAGETQIAEFVAREMRINGIDVEVNEAAPGRPNVVGVLKSKNKGPSLMLCGHLDTVGVIGMKAPFNPVERDGRMYGRGSQDMKGGLAAMISVARSFALRNGLPAGELILAAVADEEYASIGAEELVKKWKADAAIVLEPTDLQIGIAHKGFSWVEVKTYGIAAHGSRPKDGRDAILRMGRVLDGLEKLQKQLDKRDAHPLLEHASLHASLIHGGRELSTYPDECVLQLERRLLPNEPNKEALHEVQSILNKLTNEDPEFEAEAKYLFGQPSYELPSNNNVPDLLEASMSKIGRTTSRNGMSFWTDGAILGNAGIPSVIFGPGGAGLHSIEEYVRIDEVIACRDAIIEFTRLFCEQKFSGGS
jgi:acetylornithine deacetylase